MTLHTCVSYSYSNTVHELKGDMPTCAYLRVSRTRKTKQKSEKPAGSTTVAVKVALNPLVGCNDDDMVKIGDGRIGCRPKTCKARFRV